MAGRLERSAGVGMGVVAYPAQRLWTVRRWVGFDFV
jgi:hypothetical protein